MSAGFDFDAHDRYVEQGWCPKVQDKTWCNAKANHLGRCWSVYQHPYGRTEAVDLPDARIPARLTPTEGEGT